MSRTSWAGSTGAGKDGTPAIPGFEEFSRRLRVDQTISEIRRTNLDDRVARAFTELLPSPSSTPDEKPVARGPGQVPLRACLRRPLRRSLRAGGLPWSQDPLSA